jgi:hypothetical protein
MSYRTLPTSDWVDLWRFIGLLATGTGAALTTYFATRGFETNRLVPQVRNTLEPLTSGFEQLHQNKVLSSDEHSDMLIPVGLFIADHFDDYDPPAEIDRIELSGDFITPPGPSGRAVQVFDNNNNRQVPCSIGDLRDAIDSHGQQWQYTTQGSLIVLFLGVFISGILIQVITYLPRVSEIVLR